MSSRPLIEHLQQRWVLLLLIFLCIKLITLIFDNQPMLFMGDSGSYIHTALTDWKPPDRSYLYGKLIGYVIQVSGSLFSVVLVQALAGVMLSACITQTLHRYLNCNFFLSGLAGLVLCFEPLQLLYERFILTEVFALLFFAIFLMSVLEALKTDRVWWLGPAIVCAGLSVMFRTAYFPVAVTLLAFALFVLAHRKFALSSSFSITGMFRSYGAAALLLSAAVVLLSIGKQQQSEHDGYFWVAMTAPLLEEKHLVASDVSPEILQNLGCKIQSIAAREGQRWSPDCLVRRLADQYGSHSEAVAKANQIAKQVIRDKPLGFIGLGFKTYSRFWSEHVIERSISRDVGRRPLREDFLRRLESEFHIDYSDYKDMQTLTRSYMEHSAAWIKLLLLSPLVGLLGLMLFWKSNAVQGCLIVLAIASYMATICLFVTDNVVRYLHPLGYLTIVSLFCALGWLLSLKINRVR